MTKTIRLWYLYDFANSFASIVLLFYYPLILAEKNASNAWIGIPASVATAILLVLLPRTGAYSDRTGKRMHLIRITSFVMVLSLIALAFLTYHSTVFDTTTLIVLSFFYILFQVCFQSSYVFYSAMLRSMANIESDTKISGVGLGFGQLGNAIALGIIGPLIGSPLIILGLSGKPLALLLGAVLFAIISIPFFRQNELPHSTDVVRFSYFRFLKNLLSEKRAFFFLIGYSLLADAILTFQLYIAIYIKKVFDFSDGLVTYAGITGLLFGVMGGFVASKLARKLNNKERAFQISSLMYALCFGICAILPKVPVLVFAGLAFAGLSYGLVFSLARAVYAQITPENRQGEYFSMYTVFERAASIVGPLVWLATFYLLASFGEDIQYRGSVLLLAGVCLLGLYFLRKSNRVSM